MVRSYCRVRDIGSGAFGRAVLVRNQDAQLSVMRMVDVSHMVARETAGCVQEIKMLARLRHPYLIAYHETFMEGGLLCIVTDYAEGGDLGSKIAKVRKLGEPLSEQQILRWFAQAAMGLKYMHDKMIPHRNVKSRNLFLTASGGIRVGDYGISKVLERSLASASTNVKAVQYLSPEICQDGAQSFKGDVWALGCILHEMAALRLPFDEPSVTGLVLKIIRGPTPQFPKQYSGELRKICSSLLQRDAEKRPSTLEVLQWPLLQQEIRRMLNEEPAQALSATPRAPMLAKLQPSPGNSNVVLPRLLAPKGGGSFFRRGSSIGEKSSSTPGRDFKLSERQRGITTSWYGSQTALEDSTRTLGPVPGTDTVTDGAPLSSATRSDGFDADKFVNGLLSDATKAQSPRAVPADHSGLMSGETDDSEAIRSQMPPMHSREFPDFPLFN